MNVKKPYNIPFLLYYSDEISGDISMVTRGEWRARLPKSIEFMEKPVMNVLVHHTAGLHGEDTQMCSQIVRSIQNLHMDDNSRFISLLCFLLIR